MPLLDALRVVLQPGVLILGRCRAVKFLLSAAENVTTLAELSLHIAVVAKQVRAVGWRPALGIGVRGRPRATNVLRAAPAEGSGGPRSSEGSNLAEFELRVGR